MPAEHNPPTTESHMITITRKPIVAGVLTILSGSFIVWYRTNELIRVGSNWVGIALGLIAVIGGIAAVRRRRWALALAGAICAIVPPHPWGKLIWTPVLGLVAVALLISAKGEFQRA
jgi:hypothetical protein